ncbi:GDSL-type esterase/lipase family protein [Candidatus Electronema sp. PJ]|uniref:GDSL-type esterase/lipase family protein n=1 Tax=Candidatus Electronema sp. PJ TaxID=3401572 RepID=UPI003AA807ED
MKKQTLLMLGDSLVEWGDWAVLLPELEVINRGKAGELTEELSARLFLELDKVAEPDLILIMSGTNNLLNGSPYFTSIFQTLLPRLVLLCQNSTIIVNSILPMRLQGLAQDSIAAANQELRATARQSNCHFLDVTGPFNESCLPITRPGFLNDGVHLSTLGYQIWAKEISRFCLELPCPAA